jgi:hypothetical protein
MASNLSFNELWDIAVKAYLKSTGRKLDERSLMKKLHSLEDLSKQLELEQQKFSSFREKHSKLTHALHQTVRPFIAIADIATSAISLSPFAPASTILGAAVFMVQAAGGVSEAYDWIEQLLNKLGDFTSRLEEYVDGGMNKHMEAKVIDILSCLLQILAQSEKAIKDGRWKRYAAVLFLGKDEEIQASFEKLARLFESEQRLVIAISYATNQKIDRKTDVILQNTQTIDGKLGEVSSALMTAKAERHTQEQKTLVDKNLLTTALKKSRALFNEYEEKTLESSGAWLLADPQLQSWLDRKSPLL